jgi:uncharacterized membrane protein HdeD (DUF308 family)
VWTRGIAGLLLLITGAVWLAQGTNLLHGSVMSGHAGYAVLGGALLVIGVALIVWAWRIRNRQSP